ncbi:DUF4097 family beta strand repeat-containing protein [Streptomyces sp. TLI_171]|uniref:DUF4097 family beta strand repeat-containing protein n=1 Tax=Streptomyces sp. TLI_171 TaxID=1938859 RepID=UPI000C19B2E2|nr:DUF4097 family beta strand repeat-containing protein [Streptomyces sp. TLI_171]RKE18999.1 hypothetical protein BX266_2300 [Streptomyces sp. TLI_171]
MTRQDVRGEAGPAAERRIVHWLPDLAPAGPAEPGPRERRSWRIVSVLVLVVTLLAGAATTGATLAQRETTQEKTYFQPITRLDIDSGPALVSVRAGGTDRVVVTEHVGWSLIRPTVSEQVETGTLAIAVGCPGAGVRALVGCTVAVEIQVPPATEIHSRNGSGRTEIVDIAGAVSADTGSGQVELRRVSGPVRAMSGSGPITLQYDRAPESVTARLASGNLVLQVPDDGNRYRTDLSTAGGRQQIDPSVQGSGSARVLDVTSGSGTVTINRDDEH